MSHRIFVPCMLVLGACGGPALPGPAQTPVTQPAQAAAPRPFDADTARKTAHGAVFTAPKGWTLTEKNGVMALSVDTHEVSIWIVEVEGDDTKDAIAKAWGLTRPGFDNKVAQVVSPPAKDGWDEVTQVTYESPGEKRLVLALGQRKDGRTYITLIDGTMGAVERFSAQINLVAKSMKAPGVATESFAGKKPHLLDEARQKAFDEFFEHARVTAGVPGATVALIQQGKIVFSKGYGVRQLGSAAPVTPQTVFMIGSTTKSLTTLMMAKLVDEGSFAWDAPITSLYPSFAVGDAGLTTKFTMKHTVCACSGLPRQDVDFFFNYGTATPEARISALRAVKPTTAFGENFQYSNPLVSAGGYIAAHHVVPNVALGAAYDAVMQTRVFDPLGMHMTTFDFDRVRRSDYAAPHATTLESDYRLQPIAAEKWVTSVRPAGGAWSTAEDLAHYVMLELNNGKTAEGAAYLPAAALQKRRERQVRVDDARGYGLGLFLENTYGIETIGHGGNTLGFSSDMFFLPELGIGAVVLTNAGGASGFLDAVRRELMELLFDGHPEAQKALEFRMKVRREAAHNTAKLVTTSLGAAEDAAWAKALVGKYVHPTLGTVEVATNGKIGKVSTRDWSSEFGRKTVANELTKLVLLEPPYAGFSFLVSEANHTLTLETPQQSYVFVPARP